VENSTNAPPPPTIQPITGKYRDDLLRYSSEWSTHDGQGIRVKNISAVKKRRSSDMKYFVLKVT